MGRAWRDHVGRGAACRRLKTLSHPCPCTCSSVRAASNMASCSGLAQTAPGGRRPASGCRWRRANGRLWRHCNKRWRRCPQGHRRNMPSPPPPQFPCSPPMPRPPRMIRVLLADAWLAAVRLAWSQALTRPETAQRYARSQCLAAGLELLTQDVIRIDDAPFEACRLAIVYPQALLSILGQWAQRMGGQLASVQPLSVAAWMLLRRNGRDDPQGRKPKPGSAAQAVVVLDGASITIAHSLARSRWGSAWMDGLSQRHAPGGHSGASTVAQAWQRLCLREPGLSAVGAVAVLDFSAADPRPAGPGAWAPPFVRLEPQGIWIETAAAAHALSLQWRPAPWRPASWRMWQWVVVAALGVVFSALVAQLTREVSSVATLRAKTAAMERARHPVTAKKTWSRQEVAHVQAVNRAIRELNLPIDALMNALVAPKDIRVAVLGMETLGKATHAPAQTAGIKILAQACSGADMARYVVFVSGRKPFSGAH